MRSFLLLVVVVLAASAMTFAQEPTRSVTVADSAAENMTTADKTTKLERLPDIAEVPDVVPVARSAKRPGDDDAAIDPAQTAGYTRPDGKTRSKRYVKSMFGLESLARSAATAGIATWRNSPEEWGPQWEGFGKRFASNIGRNIIRQSIVFGLDEALKLDSHFYRSQKRDTKSRIVNALISPVTARKANGKRTIGIPRLTGTYAANIIAIEAWYPDRFGYKNALRAGTIALGFNAGFNLVKEFILK